MKKIVINSAYGGFSLSQAAIDFLAKDIKDRHITVYKNVGHNVGGYYTSYYEDHRDDLMLVQCIETLGDEASGSMSALKIVEIPDDIDWIIEEYDGWEQVVEKHRILG